MMTRIATAALLMLAASASAAERDPHSYAEPAKVTQTSLALDLAVDFGQRELAGGAELALAWHDPKARELVLDTRDLAIENVEAIDANGAPHPDPAIYAGRFAGRYQHRLVTGGIGHNLPQEAPQAFAQAVLDIDRG